MSIETYLIEYLSDVAQTCVEIPKDRPTKFIQIVRVGGSLHSVNLDEVRLNLDCWAETKLKSIELADEVEAAMLKCPGIRYATRYTRYDNPDPDSYSPRQTLIYTVGYRIEI